MKHDLFLTKRYGSHLTVLLIVLAGVALALVFLRAHLTTNALLQSASSTLASPR